MIVGIVLCCLLPTAADATSTGQNSESSQMYDVIDEIFDNYKHFTRPVKSSAAVTVVNVTFVLMSIIEIDEKRQTLSQIFYLDLTWYDHYLVWNSSKHGGLDHLILPQKKVWLPDVVIMPLAGSMRRLGYDELPLRLESSGKILWQPSGVFTTHCEIDITKYPFDRQVCEVSLGAWMSRREDLVLRASEPCAVSRESYTSSSEWRLLQVVAEEEDYVDSQGGTLSKVSVTYTLRRRPLFSTLAVVVPIVLLAFMSTFVFVLPAQSGQYTWNGK